MNYTQFKEKYNINLNSQQESAVVRTHGQTLLLAVPGSGKTTVIVARLGYMIFCEGIRPENILTMTYNVSAAADMKKRFFDKFGTEYDGRIEFRTINGFCAKVIMMYERIRNTSAFSLIDEGRLTKILRAIYLDMTREFPSESTVKELKTKLVYSRNMMLSEKEIKKIKVGEIDFFEFFTKYREYKNQNRIMDYDDQLEFALKILVKNPDILAYYQNKFRYISIDEAQDTSKIQHMIIRLLARQHQNIFMVGTVLMLFSAMAYQWVDPNTGIAWNYTISDGKASVGVGSSNTPAVPQTTTGTITIPSTLGDVPVTGVGKMAFYNCYRLTGVTIPSGVTSIGDEAFSGCSGLEGITIPEGVTNVGESAFLCCYGLKSVTIPDSVTNIGESAFERCRGLKSIKIPDSVTNIGESTFSGCTGLKSITIPDGVTNIGRDAFRGCYDLTSVTIPSSVTSIGPSAFSYCSGLTSVTIPEGVTSIGNALFLGCNELACVTLPSTLSAVGGNPFRGCTNCVFGFSRPNDIFSIKEGCLLSADGSYMYVGAVSNHVATIPSCVSTIGTNAYAEAVHLREVRVPSHVRRICFAAFYETGLRSVEIEDGVEMIEENAFYFSPELTSVRLPNTISYLPGYMFWDTPIGTLEIPASVTNVSENVFYHMTNLVAIVFRGDAPNVRFGRQLDLSGVPQSAEIRVRKGSLGWDHDGLSAELPASGLWPYPSGGRRIIWYGDDPWKTGWWNEVSHDAVTDPAGGWFMTNGVCRTFELPSGAATNSVVFTVSGDGVFTFDVKQVGASDYDRMTVSIDGVLADNASFGKLWRRRSYKIVGPGDHVV